MKVFIFLFVIALSVANILADCLVNTTLGRVTGGEIIIESGEEVKFFCGIPYAEPPIGPLRFQDPIPKKPWKGVFDADKEPCQCKQIINGAIIGSEDCLYVNVYVSKLKEDSKKLLPVMVYIPDHGSNCSMVMSGPQKLLHKRHSVYVCISYRLGVFGFLSTGDESAPGNFGLKDQLLALKWVQENIVYFHGDRNDVTIFGQGSGGESVHLQSISYQTKKEFKRLICLSGIAFCPRAFTDDKSYYEKPKHLGKRLKCPLKNSKELIACLRKVDVNVLIKESFEVFNEIDIATATTWRPTKEPNGPGAFLNDTPANIVKHHRRPIHPIIVSHVKDEGTFFTKNLLKNEKLYELCITRPVEVIEMILRQYPPLNGKNVRELAIKAKDYYLGSVLPKEKAIVIERYTNLMSDFCYNVQIIHFLRHLRKIHSVYVSRYSYRGTITATESFQGSLHATGVGQGSDLFSIFPIPPSILGPQYSNLKPSKNDELISDIYIDLGVSFAYNSTPVSGELKDPDMWKPQNNHSEVYLEIGDGRSPKVTVGTKYSCSVDFWFDNLPLFSLD